MDLRIWSSNDSNDSNASQALVWSTERTLPLLGGSEASAFKTSLCWTLSKSKGDCSPTPTLTTEPSGIVSGSFITLSTSREGTNPRSNGFTVVRRIRPPRKRKRVSTLSIKGTNFNFTQSSVISVTIINSSRETFSQMAETIMSLSGKPSSFFLQCRASPNPGMRTFLPPDQLIWWFPRIGHPFIDGFSLIIQPFWGSLILWNPDMTRHPKSNAVAEDPAFIPPACWSLLLTSTDKCLQTSESKETQKPLSWKKTCYPNETNMRKTWKKCERCDQKGNWDDVTRIRKVQNQCISLCLPTWVHCRKFSKAVSSAHSNRASSASDKRVSLVSQMVTWNPSATITTSYHRTSGGTAHCKAWSCSAWDVRGSLGAGWVSQRDQFQVWAARKESATLEAAAQVKAVCSPGVHFPIMWDNPTFWTVNFRTFLDTECMTAVVASHCSRSPSRQRLNKKIGEVRVILWGDACEIFWPSSFSTKQVAIEPVELVQCVDNRDTMLGSSGIRPLEKRSLPKIPLSSI